MKRTAMLLTFVIAAFLIGCDHSSVTGLGDQAPLQSDQIHKAATPYGEGKIPISGLMRDPASGSNPLLVSITGMVTYEVDEIAAQDPSTVECKISISAELVPTSSGECGWMVYAESFDRFNLSANGTATFSKSYKIQGRDDGVFLRVDYNAFAHRLEIVSLSLQKISIPPINDLEM